VIWLVKLLEKMKKKAELEVLRRRELKELLKELRQ